MPSPLACRNDDGGAWVQEWTAGGGAAWAAARSEDSGSAYLACRLVLRGRARADRPTATVSSRRNGCGSASVSVGTAPSGCSAASRCRSRMSTRRCPGISSPPGRGARPLVVVDHGGRVATSVAWAAGGAAAAARGYHWMTFDGPGRQAALRRQGLVLRPDWEAVLVSRRWTRSSPVPMSTRRGSRSSGSTTPGTGSRVRWRSSGGSPPRSLAPGIVDASRPWLDALPAPARDGSCWTRTANGSIVSFISPTLFDPEIHAPQTPRA